MQEAKQGINIVLYSVLSIPFFLLNNWAAYFEEDWLAILLILALVNISLALFFSIKSKGWGRIAIIVIFIISEIELIQFLTLAVFMFVTRKNFAP